MAKLGFFTIYVQCPLKPRVHEGMLVLVQDTFFWMLVQNPHQLFLT